MSTSSKWSLKGRGRATLVALLLVVPLTFSVMAGAYTNHPDYLTGAPGEDTCRKCHSSYGLNSGDGYVSLSGLPEKYEPGKAYILTVTVYCPDMEQYCFEMTAMAQDDDHPDGSFSCVDATETCIKGNGKMIKTTKMGCMGAVNGMKTWQIQWNSPSRAESPVTFYGCGLAGNGGGNKGGDRVYTCEMMLHPAPKVPVKPAGIIVEPGDGHVTLSWFLPETPDPRAGPVSYNIYWSDSSSGSLELLTAVPERQYTHTGLQNGRTYRYQVSGSNSEGEGALSDVVSARPDTVPDRPRHFASGSAAASGVALSWDPPSDWGSGGGNSYRLLRGMCRCSMAEIESGITGGSYTDTGPLMPNTTYQYWVQAVNSKGPGGVATLEVYVPASAPSFPLGLTMLVNRGSVELAWQPPSDDGGDAVAEYRVYRAREGEDPVLIEDCCMETSFVDIETEEDVTYEYTVAAVNSAGEGALSTPVEAYIAPPPTTGDTGAVMLSEIPFSGLVIVGAVIIIGALIMGRLSRAASAVDRDE